MQIVQQRQHAFDAHRLYVDPPSGDVQPPPTRALVFDAAYTLPDYLSIVRDHLTFTLRRLPRNARLRQTRVPLAVALLAGLAAWVAAPGALRTACAAASMAALGLLPITVNAWIVLIGTPVFLLKRYRAPACAFRIDDRGIERSTRGRTSTHAWSDLDAIHCYRRGYLLMASKGGILIPYRCLTQRQRLLFRQLAMSLHAAHAGAKIKPS